MTDLAFLLNQGQTVIIDSDTGALVDTIPTYGKFKNYALAGDGLASCSSGISYYIYNVKKNTVGRPLCQLIKKRGKYWFFPWYFHHQPYGEGTSYYDTVMLMENIGNHNASWIGYVPYALTSTTSVGDKEHLKVSDWYCSPGFAAGQYVPAIYSLYSKTAFDASAPYGMTGAFIYLDREADYKRKMYVPIFAMLRVSDKPGNTLSKWIFALNVLRGAADGQELLGFRKIVHTTTYSGSPFGDVGEPTAEDITDEEYIPVADFEPDLSFPAGTSGSIFAQIGNSGGVLCMPYGTNEQKRYLIRYSSVGDEIHLISQTAANDYLDEILGGTTTIYKSCIHIGNEFYWFVGNTREMLVKVVTDTNENGRFYQKVKSFKRQFPDVSQIDGFCVNQTGDAQTSFIGVVSNGILYKTNLVGTDTDTVEFPNAARRQIADNKEYVIITLMPPAGEEYAGFSTYIDGATGYRQGGHQYLVEKNKTVDIYAKADFKLDFQMTITADQDKTLEIPMQDKPKKVFKITTAEGTPQTGVLYMLDYEYEANDYDTDMRLYGWDGSSEYYLHIGQNPAFTMYPLFTDYECTEPSDITVVSQDALYVYISADADERDEYGHYIRP